MHFVKMFSSLLYYYDRRICLSSSFSFGSFYLTAQKERNYFQNFFFVFLILRSQHSVLQHSNVLSLFSFQIVLFLLLLDVMYFMRFFNSNF